MGPFLGTTFSYQYFVLCHTSTVFPASVPRCMLYPSFVWRLFVEYLGYTGHPARYFKYVIYVISCHSPAGATVSPAEVALEEWCCLVCCLCVVPPTLNPHWPEPRCIQYSVAEVRSCWTPGICFQKVHVSLSAWPLCKGEPLRQNGSSKGEKGQLCPCPAEPSLLGCTSIIHHLTVIIKLAREPINWASPTHRIMRNNKMVVVFKILVGMISCAAINNWNSEAQYLL